MRGSDIEKCALLLSGSFTRERYERDSVVRTWPVLLSQGRLQAAVVENSQDELVAFGASVFVTHQFADELVRRPVPHVGTVLTRMALSPESPVCTREDIARGNAGNGLDVFVLHSGLSETFGPDETMLIKAQLLQAFLDLHRGYQVVNILVEVHTPEEESLYRATGFRLVDGGAAGSVMLPPRFPVLYRCSKAELTAQQTHPLLPLIVYHHPIYGFSSNEQDLLRHAISGQTDQELAGSLNISLPGVKKRWAGILRKAEQHLPSLATPVNSETNRNARGLQRRHLLLRDLRNRPEELRPYARPNRRAETVR